MSIPPEPVIPSLTLAEIYASRQHRRQPLSERLRGHRIGLIVCGTNIDSETFLRHLELQP